MPTNLYGPGDNFDPQTSHVLPALVRRAHEAKARGESALLVWGTGRPRREFLHVDDLAAACLFALLRLDARDIGECINVGTGRDLTIAELARLVMHTVGLDASIRYDPTKPDGTPRKLLDVSAMRDRGWSARIGLEEGLVEVCDDYRARFARTASAAASP
jgi:GDP-L-fucose synthase